MVEPAPQSTHIEEDQRRCKCDRNYDTSQHTGPRIPQRTPVCWEGNGRRRIRYRSWFLDSLALDVADEAVAFPSNRFDIAWIVGGIAEGLSYLIDRSM